MERADQIRMKLRQINVWVIAGAILALVIASLMNQKILDSDHLSIYIVPGVYKLGLMTIFALYVMTIIILVNWAYLAVFKLSRPRYYDPVQRSKLIDVLKDPAVQGNIDEFRKRTESLVTQYNNHLSEIIGAILPNAIRQPFMMEQYFRAKVDNISGRHTDSINTINLLSNVAPIVGFFGTLLGLIKAFHASSVAMLTEGQMTPDTFADLQTSIMIAIITSLYGVSLKIIGSLLRHHLVSKLNNIGDEINQIPVEVLYEE